MAGRVAALGAAIAFGLAAGASAATRLIVSNDPCLVGVCTATHPGPQSAVDGGSSFLVAVIAVDDNGSSPDLAYAGTVHFSSSDPLAELPADYTFTPEDGGRKGLPATLNTLGAQSITVTDVASLPVTGRLTLVVNQAGPCVPAATVLCLDGDRFRAEARWRVTGDQDIAAGTAVAITADTGYFWFFAPSNIEVVVKVLNGCSQNGRRWVFAGGLTNAEVVLTVTDTLRGEGTTYMNSAGWPFVPVQDTAALPSCP